VRWLMTVDVGIRAVETLELEAAPGEDERSGVRSGGLMHRTVER
jgi:hypothetical protein